MMDYYTCNDDKCGAKEAMDRALLKGDGDARLFYNSSGYKEYPIGDDLITVEKLAMELPDVDYILDNIVNYMFTNSLTTKNNSEDDNTVLTDDGKLYDYLFSLNYNGQRNIDVLKSVAKNYHKYGYCGLLDTGHGLAYVPPYSIVACVINYKEAPVIKQTLTYLIKRSDVYTTPYTRVKGNPKDVQQYSEEEVLKIVKNPEDYKDEVMVVSEDVFSCVRLDTSKVFGVSPLLKDRKRVKLILDILGRMDYDIVRNGLGTIALQLKNTMEDQINESVENGTAFGSGDLVDMGRQAKSERNQRLQKEYEKFAEKLANIENNDVLFYSSDFDKLNQLKRDTKVTDFIDFISQYAPAIVCQMFGVPARLLDLNKTVSNIGTYSIIDNAMKNTIIPKRDHFIGQCMKVLEHATGFKHIKFASYEFTNDYNYMNDTYILDTYERLIKMGKEEKAEQYLEKNLIV